jgi:hypothetical protein
MLTNYQRRKDAGLTASVALPAAAANVNTAGIDLGQVLGGEIQDVAVSISVPATPALVEAKTITCTLMDSADGSTFAAVDPAITTVITGATGGAGPAKEILFRLPITTRRYIAANFAVLTGGGSNVAVSGTIAVLV